MTHDKLQRTKVQSRQFFIEYNISSSLHSVNPELKSIMERKSLNTKQLVICVCHFTFGGQTYLLSLSTYQCILKVLDKLECRIIGLLEENLQWQISVLIQTNIPLTSLLLSSKRFRICVYTFSTDQILSIKLQYSHQSK